MKNQTRILLCAGLLAAALPLGRLAQSQCRADQGHQHAQTPAIHGAPDLHGTVAGQLRAAPTPPTPPTVITVKTGQSIVSVSPVEVDIPSATSPTLLANVLATLRSMQVVLPPLPASAANAQVRSISITQNPGGDSVVRVSYSPVPAK